MFGSMVARNANTACVLALILLLQTLYPARADWINLTGAETAPNIAEITVLDDRVRVVLEISLSNLDAFKDLLPDDWLKAKSNDRLPQAERLKRFSTRRFQVVNDKGANLQADLKLIEPRMRKDRASPFAGMINPTTRQRVPGPPKDKRVIYAELEYPFAGKPDSLSFVPPSDETGNASVSIGFIAYHKAVPIIDFRYLSRAATLRLDWQDPWYTKFDNPNLKRHHKSAQMSFLYVEPREVRHEVLIRVRDLQDWTDLGLSGDTTITAEEQSQVKNRARAFFAKSNPLKVDGIKATPAFSRAEFLNISLTGPQVIENEKPLELSTAIIGIILSYPVKHLPKNVSVQWELFNERVQRIPATAIDPAGPFLSYVEASDPVLEWKNFLLKYQEPRITPVMVDAGRAVSVPLLSLILAICALAAFVRAVRPKHMSRRLWVVVSALMAVAAVLLVRVAVINVANPFAAGPPDKAASIRIVTHVLNNVNHAFAEKDPSALRKALAIVVADDTLGDVEAEIGRALAIKVAGGSIARVDAIEDLALQEIVALDGRSGFRTLAEWSARASAGHWGHVHRRTIRFRALMEIVNVDGVWRLAGMTVVDAKQQS
jgi:phosphohistidine swiveling domain-containing protein